MSTPFLSAEPVSIEQKKEPQQPKENVQSKEQTLQLPGILSPILTKYQKVVETPNDVNVLWSFVQSYLTFLEQKANLILPIIKETYPDSKEENLILSLKENSINNIPWSIYNCFLTLSNIGSTIAQKDPKDDKDKFYLLYVMLSTNNDSPTYSFTELLQTLQTQNTETQELYNTLNEKFLKAFEKYNKTPPEQKEGFMSKTYTIPYCNYEVQAKWLFIIAFIIILLLILGITGWCYSSNKIEMSSLGGLQEVPNQVSCSDIDSIAGFQSE